jgi:RecB family endonuclease NucS
LLLIKADGSVLVHADGGAYRPLNWMSAPCTLQETVDEQSAVWQVTNRAGESMVVLLEEILHDSTHELGPDPGLVKDGVEKQLQVLLAEQCQVLGEGWTLVRREYPTDIGPVDLLCRDAAGGYVAVEIKRRGEIDGVEQLTRYLRRLAPAHTGITGVLAAQEFKPQAKVLAAERGIRCVRLDYDELRGMEPTVPTLF